MLTLIGIAVLLTRPAAALRSPLRRARRPRGPRALPSRADTRAATRAAIAATEGGPPLIEAFGKGIKGDVAGRLPYYKSDVKDGLTIKSVSAVLYLFFACLSPAVAFGSLQGAVTHGAIGAVEYVTSTAVCGVIYALFSAQPLTIIGSTGPVLAFTSVLYRLAESLGVPFLPLYAWTGLWSSGMLLAAALFSLSNGVKYLTRFTDEIFSNLISAIFIYEALADVVFKSLLNPQVAAAEALATAATAATTFGCSTYLAARRGADSLKRGARTFLADFAPAIGIACGCAAGIWSGARIGATLPRLAMPATFSTTSGRPWLVPLGALPVKYRWLSAVPAVMVAVLLFFDQNITVRIVNAEGNKLEKPTGYHQDLLVVSMLAAACSATGLPWLVAATVRSINHVRANSVFESQGEELAFAGCKEQRVTGFGIHAAILGALLYGRGLLAKTPKAALMGLFLYLGTSALKGNQMFARATELVGGPLVDHEYLDAARAARRPWASVKRGKVRAFTALQLACLGAMMSLKSSPVGVLFPVIIALLGPLRWVLLKTGAYTEEELEALDSA